MSYVSNWLTPFPKREWYPAKKSRIRTTIMEDAYLEGFSVQSICSYFGIKQHYAYSVLNIKELKAKMKERLEIQKSIG